MDLKAIGYFSKTHGVKGHLILRDEVALDTDAVKAFFLETRDGGKAPYFISELKESNQGLIVKLEEINAVEQAKSLIGKKVFAESKWIEEEAPDFDWLGFEVIDAHFGPLGQVDGVTDNGQQILLNIPYQGKEVILPLVEEFIEQVDEVNKKLYFKAPDGLIEVYLSDDEDPV